MALMAEIALVKRQNMRLAREGRARDQYMLDIEEQNRFMREEIVRLKTKLGMEKKLVDRLRSLVYKAEAAVSSMVDAIEIGVD